MLAAERIKNIRQILNLMEYASVSALSAQFEVSEETIRRDLEKIGAQDPTIQRIHGGAYKTGVFDREVPVPLRETLSVAQKTQIARLCMTFIASNDTIMLDSSTTALYIAKQIRQEGVGLTVITNSLRVLEELREADNMRVISLGGVYRKNAQSYIGYQTTGALAAFHADKCFISCNGLHLSQGITDMDENEGEVRAAMAKNASRVFLVADEKKFGRSYPYRCIGFSAVDALVTEAKLDEEWRAYIAGQGTELVCPG